ncbi:MAG: ATP-grasp domain-containing protein, partial [Gemmatimonadales bacterium]|nr:ATP-grasp domain-containing protein [Gemmatimonadales bacterium]
MLRRDAVVIAGFSARALARSALAAGCEVHSVDGFGDRDLLEPLPAPRSHRTVQPFHPRRAAACAAPLPAGAAAYSSSFENHPRAVDTLARHRTLWGNPAGVLAEVRCPARVAEALAAGGAAAPRLAPVGAAASADWLAKPFRSGGGRGIRSWRTGDRLRAAEYLQEFVAGTPGSLVFLADGRRMEPLALTEQLVGDARFGGSGHQYVGSLLASRQVPLFADQSRVFESACRVADLLVRAFGLVGLG